MAKPDKAVQSMLGSAMTDGVRLEIATGLSLADIEALKADGGEAVRAEIAAKFAAQFDRLHHGKTYGLTNDILTLFSHDSSREVRLRFVKHIKASGHLPPDVANRLARDELDIAEPILLESPVLSDSDLEGIIRDMPESYALPIADRRPLSAAVSDVLIEHRGTLRVVGRLIDNHEAALSDAGLTWIFEWSLSHPEIDSRLQRRPHLPFKILRKQIAALGEKIRWDAIRTQTMTKGEASQLLGQIHGPARTQMPRGSKRLMEIIRALDERYRAGKLAPVDVIGYLKEQKINMVEFSMVVMTKLDIRQVRNLLYGSDKRGLVALCVKAGFTTSEYLALRIALSLIETGASVSRAAVTYDPDTADFAKTQFDTMRADPDQIKPWVAWPPH